jgi:hypothetical protein
MGREHADLADVHYRPRADPSARAALTRRLLLSGLLLTGLADIFRIHPHADDFYFFDAARRMPVLEVLAGQYGIYPWYRPLSRELFFYAMLPFGAWAHIVGHVIALATVGVLASALIRIGEALGHSRAGWIAALLVLAHNLTKFLAASLSGYQDLLGATLTVLAVASTVTGHERRGAILAFLAPLAKETGFLASPLCVLAAAVARSGRPPGRLIRDHLVATSAALTLHIAARLSWHVSPQQGQPDPAPGALLSALGKAAAWFVPWGLPSGVWSVVAGCAVGLAAWLLLTRAHIKQPPQQKASAGSALLFLVGTLAGLAPAIVGNVLQLSGVRAYYAYPALPWAALLLGWILSRLPSRASAALVSLSLLLSVWGLGYRAPNLDDPREWFAREPNWWEAVRISAAADRLAADLNEQLAVRPESTVVLYSRVPFGSYLQGGDGPGTREMLRDPTVRAYFLQEAPPALETVPLVIMRFDPGSAHLQRVPRSLRQSAEAAFLACTAGQARSLRAWTEYVPEASRTRVELRYLRAAAELLERGPHAYREAFHALVLADTLGSSSRELARAIVGPGPSSLVGAIAQSLQFPLTAQVHRAAAESLLGHAAFGFAGTEARLAVTLGGNQSTEYFILGFVLYKAGAIAEAREALADAIRLNHPPTAAAQARELLALMANAP